MYLGLKVEGLGEGSFQEWGTHMGVFQSHPSRSYAHCSGSGFRVFFSFSC